MNNNHCGRKIGRRYFDITWGKNMDFQPGGCKSYFILQNSFARGQIKVIIGRKIGTKKCKQ